MIAAGGNSMKGMGGSAKDCLAAEVRPITPPEIRKYRRSTNLEPGKRFVHYGVADDLEGMNLDSKVFGSFIERGSNTAADLISRDRPTELERINQLKSERIYKSSKREILGQTVDRGNTLPARFSDGGAPFGTGSRSTVEPAKDVIFPSYSDESESGQELYIKSHGSYGPGQQKDRKYDWPVDPRQTRFGMKGDTIAFNGVSKNIHDILKYTDEHPSVLSVKKVEDFRNMGDILGQSRNLGQGSGSRNTGTIYGKPSMNPKKTHWSAGEIIKGFYQPEDQLPDRDLEKSIMPGFRNVTVESRPFGCPSIRTDLPSAAIGRRSLADSQNYGDDATARELINPPAFAELNLPSTAMTEPRSKDYLGKFFRKVGYDLQPEISQIIFEDAVARTGIASISSFRESLNDYLEAVDTGSVESWRSRRRL